MRMYHYTLAALLVMAMFGCSADKDDEVCNCEEEDTVLPSGKTVPSGTALTPAFQFSDVAYQVTSTAGAEGIQARVDAANAFYVAIAQKLADADPNANFAFSPFSVQAAFGLLYPATAADGAAAKEFVAALGFDADQAAFHDAMHGHQLAVEAAFANPPAEKTLTYSLVNQVWTDESFGLQAEYLDTIKKYYNSGVGVLPLRASSEDSRTTINAFIAGNTNDLIKDLIPAGAITSDTSMVLTNSVYMLADWLQPFTKENSSPAAFANADGTSSTPVTMHATDYFQYAETSDFQALSMDYVGSKVAMLVVLPKAGTQFAAFVADFDLEDYRAAVDGLASSQVKLSLPKFSIEWGTNSIKEALQGMGMVETFSPTTNHFPKLLTKDGAPVTTDTWIQDVFHKAKVIVDEKGTEAAAATAIVVGETSSLPPQDEIAFTVDRPALFFIYETTYKGIIFAGRIAKL